MSNLCQLMLFEVRAHAVWINNLKYFLSVRTTHATLWNIYRYSLLWIKYETSKRIFSEGKSNLVDFGPVCFFGQLMRSTLSTMIIGVAAANPFRKRSKRRATSNPCLGNAAPVFGRLGSCSNQEANSPGNNESTTRPIKVYCIAMLPVAFIVRRLLYTHSIL